LIKTSKPHANLDITDFAYKKDTIGTVKIQVDNGLANTLNTKIGITGQGNQVDLTGTYKIDSGDLDFDLAVAKLNLKSIQGFTLQHKRKYRNFNGNFKIDGNSSAPRKEIYSSTKLVLTNSTSFQL
jgi:hypothetical protein